MSTKAPKTEPSSAPRKGTSTREFIFSRIEILFRSVNTWGQVLRIWTVITVIALAVITVQGMPTFISLLTSGRTPSTNSTRFSAFVAPLLKQQQIEGVILTDLDIKNNRKKRIFWESRDPIVSAEIEKLNAEMPITPIFTEDPLDKSGLFITKVINGRAGCIEYSQLNKYEQTPTIGSITKMVCASGIPPAVGKKDAIMLVLVNRVPEKQEQENLLLLLNTICENKELGAIFKKMKQDK
jgi:hypothetical protein